MKTRDFRIKWNFSGEKTRDFWAKWAISEVKTSDSRLNGGFAKRKGVIST